MTHLPTADAISPTASLALPVHLSKRERLQRVHDVLAVLGLSKASGTMVREGAEREGGTSGWWKSQGVGERGEHRQVVGARQKEILRFFLACFQGPPLNGKLLHVRKRLQFRHKGQRCGLGRQRLEGSMVSSSVPPASPTVPSLLSEMLSALSVRCTGRGRSPRRPQPTWSVGR